jgi:Mn-dependent DtxR family transcriptional regulator
MVTSQDKESCKQILIQSNEHKVNYNPAGRIKANKGMKYTRIISRLFTDKTQVTWKSV